MFCLEALRKAHDLEAVVRTRKPDLATPISEARDGNHRIGGIVRGLFSFRGRLKEKGSRESHPIQSPSRGLVIGNFLRIEGIPDIEDAKPGLEGAASQ